MISEIPSGAADQLTSEIANASSNPTVWNKLLEKLSEWAWSFLWTLIAVAVIWFVGSRIIKFVTKIIRNALKKSNMDESAAGFLVSVCNVGMKILLAFIILGCFGVTTSSIMAVIGSAGLSIGLGLQGALSNFAGGVLILVQKPFKVGDLITANGQTGTVKRIDIFYTRMLTYDNKMIVIPNGSLMNSDIENTTSEDMRLIDFKIGVDYSSDIKAVKAALSNVIKNDPRSLVTDEYPERIFISTFDASQITMCMRFWVKTDDYWPVTFDIAEEVKNEFDKCGISIPFDQLDVHLINQKNSDEKEPAKV